MKILLSYLISIGAVFGSELPSTEALKGDQVLPILSKTKKTKYLQGNSVIPHIEFKNDDLNKIVDKAREKAKELIAKVKDQKIQDLKNEKRSVVNEDIKEIIDQINIEASSVEKVEAKPEIQPSAEKLVPVALKKTYKKKRILKKRILRRTPKTRPMAKKRNSFKVFRHNFKFINQIDSTSLSKTVTVPSGSTTLARLKFGAQVPSPESEVSARIDAHFAGPNETFVMMKGCITWIKLVPHFSTKRIFGTTTKLSCRAPNKQTFEIPFNAKVISKNDEYAGLVGKLHLNGKLLASFLKFGQDITSAFGSAMSAAALTKDIIPGNERQDSFETSNVSGSSNKYITGKILESSGNFLDWHVKFHQSLEPTLSIAPGSALFLEVKDTANIPRIFFDKKKSTNLPNTNGNVKTSPPIGGPA